MRALRARLRWVGNVLRGTVEEYLADRAPMMGAAVAFYAVLALAPLLVLVVSVAGLAFGEASARLRMESWIDRTLDGAAAQVAVQFLEGASAPGTLTLPGLFSLALAIYYTARLFTALQQALNQIWNVDTRLPKGMKTAVKSVVRSRALSFVVMIAFGALLLASLALETALPVIAQHLAELPGSWYLYRLLVLIGSTLVVGLGVAVVYRLLPAVRVKWHYIWGGAMFTSALLVLGKLLLGLYLASGAMLTVPGAASSVFALLLWTYYSAQVFFFGAELTQVVARQRGHGFGALPPPMHKTVSPPPSDAIEPLADPEPESKP